MRQQTPMRHWGRSHACSRHSRGGPFRGRGIGRGTGSLPLFSLYLCPSPPPSLTLPPSLSESNERLGVGYDSESLLLAAVGGGGGGESSSNGGGGSFPSVCRARRSFRTPRSSGRPAHPSPSSPSATRNPSHRPLPTRISRKTPSLGGTEAGQAPRRRLNEAGRRSPPPRPRLDSVSRPQSLGRRQAPESSRLAAVAPLRRRPSPRRPNGSRRCPRGWRARHSVCWKFSTRTR